MTGCFTVILCLFDALQTCVALFAGQRQSSHRSFRKPVCPARLEQIATQTFYGLQSCAQSHLNPISNWCVNANAPISCTIERRTFFFQTATIFFGGKVEMHQSLVIVRINKLLSSSTWQAASTYTNDYCSRYSMDQCSKSQDLLSLHKIPVEIFVYM